MSNIDSPGRLNYTTTSGNNSPLIQNFTPNKEEYKPSIFQKYGNAEVRVSKDLDLSIKPEPIDLEKNVTEMDPERIVSKVVSRNLSEDLGAVGVSTPEIKFHTSQVKDL